MAGSAFYDGIAPTGVVIDEVEYAAGQLQITGRSRSRTSVCPGCDRPSARVHSRLEWTPCAGQGHAADLTMNREYCCSNCAGRT
jgi:hypothetical protein